MRGIAVIAVLVLGCASMGRPIPWSDVAKLEPGVSTLADAKRILGPPDVVEVEKEQTKYGWTYAHASLGGGRAEAITLAFGLDGRLLGKPPPADAMR